MHTSPFCRARLKRVKHCLSQKEVEALAAQAHGFVGADLAALCQEAAAAALRRAIQQAFKCPLMVSSVFVIFFAWGAVLMGVALASDHGILPMSQRG